MVNNMGRRRRRKKMMMMGSKRTICSCPNPTFEQLGDIAWKDERNFAFQDKNVGEGKPHCIIIRLFCT